MGPYISGIDLKFAKNLIFTINYRVVSQNLILWRLHRYFYPKYSVSQKKVSIGKKNHHGKNLNHFFLEHVNPNTKTKGRYPPQTRGRSLDSGGQKWLGRQQKKSMVGLTIFLWGKISPMYRIFSTVKPLKPLK